MFVRGNSSWGVCRAGFALAALALLALVGRAEAPLPAPVDFEPTMAHPRSSEGSFATLHSGRIIFCYSQFYEGRDDDSPSAIAQINSDDGGKSWSEPKIVVPTGDNRNLMSVSLLRLASGKLAMFYLAKKNGWLDCHPLLAPSTHRLVCDSGF